MRHGFVRGSDSGHHFHNSRDKRGDRETVDCSPCRGAHFLGSVFAFRDNLRRLRRICVGIIDFRFVLRAARLCHRIDHLLCDRFRKSKEVIIEVCGMWIRCQKHIRPAMP